MTTLTRQNNARAELAKRDFRSFCKFVHEVDLPRHTQFWLDPLLSRAPEDSQVAIAAPPEFWKSRIARMYIEWSIGRNPEWCRILAMNAAAQAAKQVMAIEATIEQNERYRLVFPEVQPDYERGWNQTSFFIKRKSISRPDPTLTGCGVNGPIQGLHCEEVFCDDLTDQQDPISPTTMDAQRKWLRGVLYDRCIKDPGSGLPIGKFWVICTRWGDNDLFPTLTNKTDDPDSPGMGFKKIQTPAVRPYTPYPWGPLLWPEEFTERRLESVRLTKGQALYAMTYLCDPSALGGLVFQTAKLMRYDLGSAPDFGYRVHSWDCALSTSDEAAFTAVQEWATGPRGLYLTWAWRGKVRYGELKELVIRYRNDRRPNKVLIENASTGTSLILDFEAEGGMPELEPMPHKNEEKTVRASRHSALIDSGLIWVPYPRNAAWVTPWEEEMKSFPKGVQDDQVDAFTHAMTYLRGQTVHRSSGFASWLMPSTKAPGPPSNRSWL